jgi:hypothetical protein
MEKKKFNNSGIMAAVVGITFIGMALSGFVPGDYWLDEAEECKDSEVLQDVNCGVYPYQDGNGKSFTPESERWTADETDYKTPYDVFADAVRYQCDVQNECNPQATYLSEIEFFCIIESFDPNGFLNFPGNIAQVIISYEAESGFDMSNSLIMIQDVCYPGGAGGTYIQGDLPTLEVPK